MKVFTSLMKTLITVVSIALTVLLVVTAAPLVMGGIEVENTEEITITASGSNLNIKGALTVKSTLPNDITDLTVSIDTVSLRDGSMNGVNIYYSPPRTIASGSESLIKIDATVNIAEVVMFILADTGNERGIYLPIQISVGAEYGGLAGFEMNAVSIVKLSEDGYLEGTKMKNDDGEVYQAQATYHGTEGDMLLDLIPSGGLNAELYVKGKESLGKIHLDIEFIDDETVNVVIMTEDPSVGLNELAQKMIDENNLVSIYLESGGAGFPLADDQMTDIKNYLNIFLGGIPDA